MAAVYLHTRDDNPRVNRVRERLEKVLATMDHAAVAEPQRAGLIVSIGGDGTLLSAIARYHHLQLPFLGVNAGNLGFLQEADEEDLEQLVARLQARQYEVVQIPLLEVWDCPLPAGGEEDQKPRLIGYAFNEALLERAGTRTLKIIMRVNGLEIGVMVGDGAMVSSPAGSTAYSLAAGGAIMAPNVQALQLVTLNPHPSMLASPMPTPIILAPDSKIDLLPTPDRPQEARLVIDGRGYPLAVGAGVTVRFSRRTVGLVKLGIHTFWEHVREKFSPFEQHPLL